MFFWCTKCNKRHRKSSMLGKRHKKYIRVEPYFCKKCGNNHNNPNDDIFVRHAKFMKKEKENPLPLLIAAAPMAIDVGKEYVKDPKLLFKPTGAIRAIGRSFGFGKGAKENPPKFTDFENRYGKRVDAQIRVLVNETDKDFNPGVFIYYRFTKRDPNLSIVYDNEAEGMKVFFGIEGRTYVADDLMDNDILRIVDIETGEVFRLDRDSESWILYPASGEIGPYVPEISDDFSVEKKGKLGKPETILFNPLPRVNGWGSIVKAAKPLIKKAVPAMKSGAKYIAKHPELITATGEAVAQAGKGVEGVVATARGERPQQPQPYPTQPQPPQPQYQQYPQPYPTQPQPQPQPQPYPTQPQPPQPQYPAYYYPYPQNPRRKNPKKIMNKKELYEFIGGK